MTPAAYNINLPKWPGMIVEGDDVSPATAAEILIKTDGHIPDFEHAGNNPKFAEQLHRIFGIPSIDWKKRAMDHYEKLQALREQLGVLELEYLRNSRIVSSWIGGPNGWVNWQGKVGSHNKNIGNWPSVEAVHREWMLIAKTFPALKLTCWLYAKGTCEEENYPLVRFDVKNGDATVHPHSEDTVPKAGFSEGTINDFISRLASGKDFESGISPQDLEKKILETYGYVPQYGAEAPKRLPPDSSKTDHAHS